MIVFMVIADSYIDFLPHERMKNRSFSETLGSMLDRIDTNCCLYLIRPLNESSIQHATNVVVLHFC